jgi:hypothetical protein
VIRCDREQLFERADAGHAIADDDETGLVHDVDGCVVGSRPRVGSAGCDERRTSLPDWNARFAGPGVVAAGGASPLHCGVRNVISNGHANLMIRRKALIHKALRAMRRTGEQGLPHRSSADGAIGRARGAPNWSAGDGREMTRG